MAEDYCTVADIKEIASDVITTDDYDDALAAAIPRASRLIDAYKHREEGWFVAESTASARYFDGYGETDLHIDECVSITSVEYTDDGTTWTAWASTDYQSLPANKLPIRKLRMDPYQGDYTKFASGWSNYKITAKWGYSVAVPDVVKAACIAQVLYAFKRAQQAYQDQGGLTESGVVLRMRGLCQDAKDYLAVIPNRVEV